jgi:protein-L-isoaspartate(D-aspartate) O-methyltransferase
MCRQWIYTPVVLLGIFIGGVGAVHCSGESAEPGSSTTTAPATQPTTTTAPAGTQPGQWRPPVPPGVKKYKQSRQWMVDTQIAHPHDGRRAVKDKKVLEAMRTVPRHEFVPAQREAMAYRDTPLPIGHGQTISQPYIVALMTELLEVSPQCKVLEVGTGSGYQAAVLANLTPQVYTVEIIKGLHEQAERILKAQGYGYVKCKRSDGYWGWVKEGPFDRIILTFAAKEIPEPLWKQLKPGGRMVIPLGSPRGIQRLTVATKTKDGERRTESVIPVRFVPMLREK